MPRQHALSRTELLIGKEALNLLRTKKAAVLGIGGVGGFAVEALARCGLGRLLIVDDDTVCLTNLNRQIHATHATIGKKKVDVMKTRIAEIDPKIMVEARHIRVTADTISGILEAGVDYVIDALDTISAKIALAEYCFHHSIPIISCMGAGNKLDPTKFAVADVYKTKACPLAKVMRGELKKRNVPCLKVVYSEETPLKPLDTNEMEGEGMAGEGGKPDGRKHIPASISFVPPVAGFILAGEAIKDLIQTPD